MGEEPARRRGSWVVPLCWAAVLLDGFDQVVIGVVLPVLLRDRSWSLTPAGVSVLSTIGLVGMTVGALAIGTVTDVIGRRRALILAVAAFSLCTLCCALASSALVFGLLRFLAGLGLGGCLPTAITMVTEHRRGRGGSAATTVITGYQTGAMLTALVGIWVLPALGWRAMFVLGALPAVVLLPLMLLRLPESAVFTEAEAEAESDAPATGRQAVAGLFRDGMLRSTLAFWAASFMGLVLVYGMNTWLPEIMRQAGYPLGAALGLLLTLNLGAILGLVLAGWVADRFGVRPSALGWFLGAAASVALLSVRLPGPALYLAVFLSGCFVFSAQALVYGYVGRSYGDRMRATGVGWTAGVGRVGAIVGPLFGGLLVTAGIAYPWGFYVFAVAGVLGAAGVIAVRVPRPAELSRSR